MTDPAPGGTQVQYVIARSSVPSAPQPATHIYFAILGDEPGLGPAEYFTYNTCWIIGHPAANGSNGTAAYGVFRTIIPESYTSLGPATFYFDKNGNRLATPEVRLQPGLAAADGADTSFFYADYVCDLARCQTSSAPVRPLLMSVPSRRWFCRITAAQKALLPRK